MAFGTFLPVLSAPLVGNQNYFQNGQGDGVFVIVLAAITGILALTAAIRFAWISAATAGAFLIYALFNFVSLISDAQAELEASLEGNPFAGLAEGLAGAVQLQWGWLVMFAGVGASLYGSLAKFPNDGTQNPQDEE
jgi:hypothetical protein